MSMLTKREQEVYDCVVRRLAEGLSPTVREICAELGIKSTSSAHKYLKSLEEKGLLMSNDRANRSIRITKESPAMVPLLGTITAGQPILAIEQIEDYVHFRPAGGGSEGLFALRVRGESMIGAAILDGDIIIVRRTPVVENGAIAAVLVDDEATVKRFFREDGRFRLQPENPDMEPIIVEEATILGKVVGVLRTY